MRSASRGRGLMGWALMAAAAVAAFLGVLAASAVAQPTPGPASVIDGPSADIDSLGGLAVARDGSGGLVYLKDVSGVAHVFVSRLVGGVFQPPDQVDAGLGGASSQPVVAAGNGGLLLVAFINAGQLLVVNRATSTAAYTAPSDLVSGASNPAISITTLGKAYLAFTADSAGSHDVRCAYYYNGQWAIEPSPLDVVAGDDAGTGTGRPAVAAAGDGVGIVAWGEGGHIYTRRVWATSPSIVFEQADWPALGSWSEVSADQPAVASGGDSSYAAVAFRELLSNGSGQQSRVLMQRLHGSRYDGVVQPDGLATPGAEGADQPQVAAGEYGEGFVTSERDQSRDLVATRLGSNESPQSVLRVDSAQNTSAPFAVPTTFGLHSALLAWQQDPGLLADPDIRARFFDGSNFEQELVLSSSSMGPAQASRGLDAAGDIAADVGVAWVQGSASSRQIVVAQMYQPPGSFGASSGFQYVRSTQPVLSWSASRQLWGPLRYDVTLDGAQVGQTSGTSVAIPNAQYPIPVTQGPHSWQVTAVNPVGVTRSDRPAKIFVDTVAPVLRIGIRGKKRVGSAVHVTVNASDSPPPVSPADASGIAQVRIKFGDGTSYQIHHGKYHVYHRARTYKITVTVSDRAGNSTTVVTKIKIKSKPKKHKAKHGHH